MDKFQKTGIIIAIIVIGIILASNVTSLFLNYNIANSFGKLQTEISFVKDGVRQSGEELSTLKQQFGAIQSTVDGIQVGLGKLGSNYQSLKSANDSIRTNIGEIGTALQTTRGTLTELGDTIKQFEDFLASTGNN